MFSCSLGHSHSEIAIETMFMADLSMNIPFDKKGEFNWRNNYLPGQQ